MLRGGLSDGSWRWRERENIGGSAEAEASCAEAETGRAKAETGRAKAETGRAKAETKAETGRGGTKAEASKTSDTSRDFCGKARGCSSRVESRYWCAGVGDLGAGGARISLGGEGDRRA
jgi:hypothetical protein